MFAENTNNREVRRILVEMDIWVASTLFILCPAIVLHITSLATQLHTNGLPQKEILVNLSFSELCISATALNISSSNDVNMKVIAAMHSLYVTFYGTMIVMMLDRFSSIHWHLLYQTMFIKRRIKLIIILLWLGSILLCLVLITLYLLLWYS